MIKGLISVLGVNYFRNNPELITATCGQDSVVEEKKEMQIARTQTKK